jgi:hypothetical protein
VVVVKSREGVTEPREPREGGVTEPRELKNPIKIELNFTRLLNSTNDLTS